MSDDGLFMLPCGCEVEPVHQRGDRAFVCPGHGVVTVVKAISTVDVTYVVNRTDWKGEADV